MNGPLEVLQTELKQALADLDERQTLLRPANESARWSIQQIAGHLRLTYAATVEAMDTRIAKVSPTKGKPSLIQYAAQFTLIRFGYFPKGRKAPERVCPALDEAIVSGSVISADMDAALSLLASRIDKAEELFGSKGRVVSHMILGPLSVDQWRKFHLIHGRHHIQQIRAIRREHGI